MGESEKILSLLSAPLRIQGASPSAQAYLLARIFSSGASSPWILIFRDDDAAAEFASDLESFLDVFGANAHLLQIPTWDQSPYSSIAPSIRTRLARIAALSALHSSRTSGTTRPDKEPIIALSSIAALCQSTLSPKSFENLSLLVQTGTSVGSREALMQRLVDAGYLRVDTVEDPGTFGVRGDIVDVFPPDREEPLRIELFDNEVERIRSFDSATQRTLTDSARETREVVVPPAREVLIHSGTSARIREKAKARADDRGITRAVRDPLLQAVQNGNYPDHSDAWADFAYEDPSTLLDHFPGDARVVWVDEFSCLESWGEFFSEQKELSESPEQEEQEGLILPTAAALFRWDEKFAAALRAKSALYLDRVQLTQANSSTSEELAVTTQGNSDFSLSTLDARVGGWLKQRFSVLVLSSTQSQLERLRFLFEERGFSAQSSPGPGVLCLAMGSVTEGFQWPAEGLVVLSEDEVLGRKRAKKQRRASRVESGSAAKDWSGLQALSDLSPGDAVVHVDHGIGLYRGLARLSLSGAPSDFLLLEYADKDKLYLPVYRLNAIQKYVGAGAAVTLDKLGGSQFAKNKEKVRSAVKKLAIDLIQLYAERKVRPGIVLSGRDSLFQEFEAKFSFDETPDQLKAIDQALSDMESGRVMDRLICGDVGYGKTEVALRAAFRAVSDGKQVAVLVPTTVLSFQHEQSFRARMKDYPILIESVSRFKSSKEQKEILAQLARGKVDIIIGTHRLLSKDVKFHDLGLIIVDEEHRFGVEHKERLKTLRTNTHVMTLTATPIPRTLHMALSGLRDISVMNTPPVDRLPIRTYVSKFDEELIARAIRTELSRGGQVFFLHNRIQSIGKIAETVGRLVPEARVGVGHGQMNEGELEKVMLAFYQKKTNVLVSTTIIESGLDIPSANTIIIDRADSLGLAQLYQIRGRVGRSQQRAYAYLLIPAETGVTEDAKRRLEIIQRFVELGSGFSVASHDLELRGGGDLLGPQQSGHIAAVGFDLYTELLEEAIRELDSGARDGLDTEKKPEPEIKIPFPAFLSDDYIPDVHQRLSLYRRFSASTEEREVVALEEELQDRFGPLPPEALNLLWMIRLKQLLSKTGIEALTVGPERVSLLVGAASAIDPVLTLSVVAGDRSKYQLTPDKSGSSKLVVKMPTEGLRDLFFGIESLLRRISTKPAN